MTKSAGYIFENWMGIDNHFGWELKECLSTSQTNPDYGLVYGDNILNCYIDDGIRYFASGHDNIRAYISENGSPIDFRDQTPSSIKAMAGPLKPNVLHLRPYAGGISGTSNMVFAMYYRFENPDYLDIWSNFGLEPPIIRDMICDRRLVLAPVYVTGTRSTNSQNIVVYINSDEFHTQTPLNLGLDNVNRGNSIIKSPEIHQQADDFYPVIYLGTENGIYKTNFDGSHVLPWRKVSNGINPNMEIIDLANYGQGISYYDKRPDSITEYALGKDANGLPYIYISADSGRSWIEDGGYLREHSLTGNAISSISALDASTPNKYYLAVGTNRGVYRYPYNVKSGTITHDDAWGPGLVIVNGDVTVPSGVILTIAAGTTVKFTYRFDRMASGSDKNKSEINVYGVLNIGDETTNRVVLTSSSPTPKADDWYGIIVNDQAKLTMKNCDLQYANTGITAGGGSQVSVYGSHFSDCFNAGFYGKGAGNPDFSIRHSQFVNCLTYATTIVDGNPAFDTNTVSGDVA